MRFRTVLALSPAAQGSDEQRELAEALRVMGASKEVVAGALARRPSAHASKSAGKTGSGAGARSGTLHLPKDG